MVRIWPLFLTDEVRLHCGDLAGLAHGADLAAFPDR